MSMLPGLDLANVRQFERTCRDSDGPWAEAEARTAIHAATLLGWLVLRIKRGASVPYPADLNPAILKVCFAATFDALVARRDVYAFYVDFGRQGRGVLTRQRVGLT